MSPLMVLGLVKFILTSGPDIVEQCDLAVKFAQDLLSDYRCLLYTSPSPRDRTRSRMPSSA